MIRFLFDTEGLMTPIGSVSQHPENDNNGDVDEIVASMSTVGVYRPIYASAETGYIVAGNHTYLGMLELGADFVPVIWLQHLTPAMERRILYTDNKIARNARPDPRLRGTGLDLRGEQVRRDLDEHGAARRGDRRDEGRGDEPAQRIGRETLQHRIECPECGHQWSRQSGEF